MGIEDRPQQPPPTEPAFEQANSFAAAVNTLAETVFACDSITQRLQGYVSDKYLQLALTIYKQALAAQLAEMSEEAIKLFLTHIDGLQTHSGVPLYPPLSDTEAEPPNNVVNRYKPFNVASICREDLRGILTNEEIGRLNDSDMESIADRMSGAYRDSGGYWQSLEIMAKWVLEKDTQ